MKNVLTLDIGGSAIKYALIDENRAFLAEGKTIAPRETEEQFVRVIGELYDQFEDRVSGIGISMAGKLDPESTVIKSSGQYPFLTDKSLADVLKDRCPVKITVRNDAHAAAIAELHFGSLQNIREAVVLVMGTGIGGALVFDGKIREGINHCAGEFSLVRTDRKADLSHAWAFYGGGAAGLATVAEKYLKTGRELTGIEIFELCNHGNQAALSALDEYCMITAIQIYNFQSLFDVQRFAIGGGISAQPLLFEYLERNISLVYDSEKGMNSPNHRPEVVPCAFRNDANLIGVWYDNLTKSGFYQV